VATLWHSRSNINYFGKFIIKTNANIIIIRCYIIIEKERGREAARLPFRIDERKEKLWITFEITLTTRQVIFVTVRIVLDKFHLS